MPTRVAQILIKIRGGVRAALEARAVAAGLHEVADGTDDVKTSALAAGLAMSYLERAERKVARAQALVAGTSLPTVGGFGLMIATAVPLAFVILPALAVALWQVTVAAGVMAAAMFGGFLGLGAAIGLFAVGVMQRFRRLKDVAGTAAFDLANQLWLLKETFLDVVSGGADRAMGGVSDALKAILPIVRSLRDEFTAIGGAIGDFFRALGQRVGQMGPQISTLLSLVPGAVDALAQFAGDALGLFIQLATVGMPILIRGLRLVAGWMRDLTDWFSPERVVAAEDTLRGFFAGIKSFWNDFTDPIKAVIGPAIDEAGTHLTNWARPLGVLVAGLIQVGRILLPPISALLAKIGNELAGVGGGIDGLDVKGIADALVVGVKAAVKWVGRFISALKPALPIVENIIAPLAAGLLQGFAGPALDIIKFVASAIGLLGKAAAPLKPLFYLIGQALSLLFGGELLRAAGAIIKAIPIIGRLGVVVEWVGIIWQRVSRLIGELGALIGARIGGLAGTVIAFVTSTLGRFTFLVGWFSGLPQLIATAATGLWEGLKSGLVAVVTWITDKIDWVVKKIQWAVDQVGKLPGLGGGGLLSFDPVGAFEGVVHSLTHPFGRAGGGVTGHGELTLVGERGPELAAFPTGTRIYPADITRGLLAPGAAALAPAAARDPFVAAPALVPVLEAEIHTHVHTDSRETARSTDRVRLNLNHRR